MLELEPPLVALRGGRPPAPTWFGAALEATPEEGRIQVAGAAIEALAWGERGRPGLLLLHGGMAHAHWWAHVAPLLARTHRVAALSWSGMGGSDWREAYSVDLYVEEALAVSRWAGLFDAGAPAVAAHSFGAAAGARLAHVHGGALAGVAILDSGAAPPSLKAFARRSLPGGKAYPSLEAALARFRLAPEQPVANLFIADMIARHSLREADGQWRWRFDPDFFTRMERWDSWAAIAAPACPLAFVYGEFSHIATSDVIARQRSQAPAGTPFIELPQSHHHLMIDQPLALVAVLRTLCAVWTGAA
jgi:pimeloyl-ACP methyl ester carboxylesterase